MLCNITLTTDVAFPITVKQLTIFITYYKTFDQLNLH